MNYLYFLENVASSSSIEGAATTTPEISQYTTFEIIFWYSALVVTVVLFIIYLRVNSKKKKRMNNLLLKLDGDINRYDSLIKQLSQKGLSKKKYNDIYIKTTYTLAKISDYIVEINEKTRLSDCDNIINLINKINKKIKKYQLNHTDVADYLKSIRDTQADLIRLKGQLELLKDIIK